MIHTPQFHHPHHPHHRSLQVRTTLILFSSIYRYLLLDISVPSCVILEKLAFSLTFFSSDAASSKTIVNETCRRLALSNYIQRSIYAYVYIITYYYITYIHMYVCIINKYPDTFC